MSVHKHDRHESQLQFIETARQLEIFTLRNCVKFPKRYTFFITTEIVRLSQSVYNNVKAANSVFPSGELEVQMRRDYLTRANCDLQCLISQKEQLGIKYYCRYMDDGCLIHHSKEHLQYCLKKITEICTELGIKLNTKKTQIVKLSRGINFLKTHFILTKTGKIVRKPYRKNITLMRRKLKTFKRWVDEGKMTFEDVMTSWCSWRGHQLKFNSYWARQRIHDLYVRLFYWS